MKYFLRSSGGFANLSIEGEIDTDDLPEEMAERTLQVMTPANLAGAGSPDPGAADMMQYEVTILGDEARRFVIDDSAPAEVLELVDELISRIVQRKADAPR